MIALQLRLSWQQSSFFQPIRQLRVSFLELDLLLYLNFFLLLGLELFLFLSLDFLGFGGSCFLSLDLGFLLGFDFLLFCFFLGFLCFDFLLFTLLSLIETIGLLYMCRNVLNGTLFLNN